MFRTFELVCVSSDLGDGTYALTWSADIPGGYDLHVTHDRTPILGSPFHCHLSSAFVRPPLEVAPSLVPYAETNAKTAQGKPAKSRDTAVPAPSEAPAAAGRRPIVCLSTALSTPTAAWWPSVHVPVPLGVQGRGGVQRAGAAAVPLALLPPPLPRLRRAPHPRRRPELSVRAVQSGGPARPLTASRAARSTAPRAAAAAGIQRCGPTAARRRDEGFAALYIPADTAAPGGSGGATRSHPVAAKGGGKGGEGEGEEGDGPGLPTAPPCLLLSAARADGGSAPRHVQPRGGALDGRPAGGDPGACRAARTARRARCRREGRRLVRRLRLRRPHRRRHQPDVGVRRAGDGVARSSRGSARGRRGAR